MVWFEYMVCISQKVSLSFPAQVFRCFQHSQRQCDVNKQRKKMVRNLIYTYLLFRIVSSLIEGWTPTIMSLYLKYILSVYLTILVLSTIFIFIIIFVFIIIIIIIMIIFSSWHNLAVNFDACILT